MLLSSRMASIPYSPRQSISNMKDFQQSFATLTSTPPPPVGTSLQFFNMRVTERLHRYRSLKRQWNEVASNIQIDASLPSKFDVSLHMPDIIPIAHEQLIKDYLNSTSIQEKTSLELDPLRSQIQKDLIKLRKLIKARQKKLKENHSTKTNTHNRPCRETFSNPLTRTLSAPTSINDLEKTYVQKLSTINKTNNNNTLDYVKISGSQMRPTTFPENESPINNKQQSSSTCSNYTKQQNIQHIFNIYRTRVNHNTLPSDSLIQGIPPPKKKINIIPSKTTSNTPVKQTTSYRLPIPSIIKKKQTIFIKPEPIQQQQQQPLPIQQTTTCRYTYAASTSSTSPHSMKLNRKTSLLPILLKSSSCIGTRSHIEKSRDNNDYSYNLLDYKHLITHLPKPIVPILPKYDQDEYGILFEQLEHIRETMPNSNVYEHYTRIY